MPKLKPFFVIAGAIVALTIITIIFAGDRLTWRMEVVTLKAQGELSEISWEELFRWMLPDSPVYLDRLIVNPNPDVALKNDRLTTPADVAAGAEVFRSNCSSCHGSTGEGVNAPPLNISGRGLSDWDLFRTIQQGIPGTSMPAHESIPDRAIWQTMSYISTLKKSSAAPQLSQLLTDLPSVGFDQIRNPAAENWPTYSGRLSGWRYSELDQIDPANAHRMALRWAYQMDTAIQDVETNPVVINGVMFITEPPGRVAALDAANGMELWSYERSVPGDLKLCCGVVNRGVAVLKESVFVASIDAHLVALDARTGQERWSIEVADHRAGYSITAAPLVIGDLVVTGVAGGETGTRGFLDAYDVESGELVWRFYTVPDEEAELSKGWRPETLPYGGSPTWMTGSYDAELDLLYWGTGHPVHNLPGVSTPGDRLYGCTLLAIRGSTGELVWHFQFTPDDRHGFDATQIPVLIDRVIDGIPRKLVTTANRNGYFYVLDRTTGEFVTGKPFVKQTWSKGLGVDGRPIQNETSWPTTTGTIAWPSSVGGTNWWPPAYHPGKNVLHIPAIDMPSTYYAQEDDYEPGEYLVRVVGRQDNQPIVSKIVSVEATTGRLLWEKQFPLRSNWPWTAGLLTTAGDIIVAADLQTLHVMDGSSGDSLLSINTGGRIKAAPVTYGVAGKQFIALTAGRSIMAFALPDVVPE